MANDENIKDLVLGNFKAAAVLHQYGIRFWEHLDDSLPQVCRIFGVDPQQLEERLRALGGKVIITPEDLRNVEAILVIEYLRHTHHAYTKLMLPLLKLHTETFRAQLEDAYPVLKPVQEVFADFSQHLHKHISMEENRLFPHVVFLDYWSREFYPDVFWAVRNKSLKAIEESVPDAEGLKEIRGMTAGFAFDTDDHPAYQVLMMELADFDRELDTHQLIEEQVLMPVAYEKEKVIFSKLRELSRLN